MSCTCNLVISKIPTSTIQNMKKLREAPTASASQLAGASPCVTVPSYFSNKSEQDPDMGCFYTGVQFGILVHLYQTKDFLREEPSDVSHLVHGTPNGKLMGKALQTCVPIGPQQIVNHQVLDYTTARVSTVPQKCVVKQILESQRGMPSRNVPALYLRARVAIVALPDYKISFPSQSVYAERNSSKIKTCLHGVQPSRAMCASWLIRVVRHPAHFEKSPQVNHADLFLPGLRAMQESQI